MRFHCPVCEAEGDSNVLGGTYTLPRTLFGSHIGVVIDWVCFDVVGIHSIEYHNIIVPAVGCDWESAHLVCEELPRYLNNGHENHVCFVIVGCLFVVVHVVDHVVAVAGV